MASKVHPVKHAQNVFRSRRDMLVNQFANAVLLVQNRVTSSRRIAPLILRRAILYCWYLRYTVRVSV